jgi:hypothetical protein
MSDDHKTSDTHKADSFDGGRAASAPAESEPPSPVLSLRQIVEKRAQLENDDDARALALAILALTSNND